MLLTCPSCRSGLEVPDGTTALVRCPACTTVFAPAPSAPPDDDEDDTPPPRRRAARRREEDEDEDDRPRRRPPPRSRRDEDDEDDEDDEPEERRRTRPRPDDGLSPEERKERRRAFERAALGARLIAISFALFMFSMLFATGFFFQGAFTEPSGAIVVVAGLFGLANWLLGAVGVGLCLSGPPSPGHWEYGIGAAIATAVHALLLVVLVGSGKEASSLRVEGATGLRWDMLPTQLNATMFYITAVVYPDAQGIAPKGRMLLSMITGVAEMVRMVMILMLLSCLAQAALDSELSAQCTRAAGRVSGGPGLMALLIFAFVAVLIETNAGVNMFTRVLSNTVYMGMYAIVSGFMLPAYLAAQATFDACDEPFQSLIPNA